MVGAYFHHLAILSYDQPNNTALPRSLSGNYDFTGSIVKTAPRSGHTFRHSAPKVLKLRQSAGAVSSTTASWTSHLHYASQSDSESAVMQSSTPCTIEMATIRLTNMVRWNMRPTCRDIEYSLALRVLTLCPVFEQLIR